MNAKKASKSYINLSRHSKLLLRILDLMKERDYVDYEMKDNLLKITIKDITECKAIKPRYAVGNAKIEKYIRRFLPARNIGFVIISTSKGLMTHQEAAESKIGGSLIAYFY